MLPAMSGKCMPRGAKSFRFMIVTSVNKSLYLSIYDQGIQL